MSSHRFVTLLAVVGVSGCAAPRAGEPPITRAVRVVEARVAEAPPGLRYAVTIQPAESVTLALKSSGYVARIHQVPGHDGRPRTLQPGDVVRAGTELVGVRDAEYRERLRQAEGGLEEGAANQVKARLDLDRARALFAADSLTTPERDAAQAAFDAASARLLVSRAQVEAARLALDDCRLVAPMSGVVLERRIEGGMLASAGTVAFVLGRVADVKAVLGVPDTIVSRLSHGQRLTMRTEALPGVPFVGHVTGVAPAADPQSRVFAVEVTVANRDGRLKPGMIGAIELTAPLSSRPTAHGVAVPLAAVVRAGADPNGFSVFVVESADGHEVARARPVTLGAAVGNAVAVTQGVGAGERVIVMGATLVADGEPVRVIP